MDNTARRLAVWGYGTLIAFAFFVLILAFGAGLTVLQLLPFVLVGVACVWLSTRTINRRYAAREAERQAQG